MVKDIDLKFSRCITFHYVYKNLEISQFVETVLVHDLIQIFRCSETKIENNILSYSGIFHSILNKDDVLKFSRHAYWYLKIS